MATKDSVEERTGVKVPPGALTTPCSLQALQNWVLGAHAVAPGIGGTANITTTTTSIAVA